MMTVIAKATCRCCQIEMQFRSMASARAALETAGLSETAVVVDDEGTKHDFVNTFESMSLVHDEPQQLAA